jgi:hypothetical protein
MKTKALMKVLATWIIIALLVIAYLIDERSIIFVIGIAAFILFSMFLYALYSGNLEEKGRVITKEMPSYPKPKPGSCVRNHDTNFKE